MPKTLRPYQQECITKAQYFCANPKNKGKNGVIVGPTGCGKAIMIADVIKLAIAKKRRVLVLAHQADLLVQNSQEAIEYIGRGVDIGLNSATLKTRRFNNQVVMAGIQSVHNKASQLVTAGQFDIVLIDEVHRVPEAGDGTYRKLLSDLMQINPNLIIIGFTATPFRLNGGIICKPNNIFNEIIHEIPITELFELGYLCNVISQGTSVNINFDGLRITNNEYNKKEVERRFDQATHIDEACQDIIKRTHKRKSILIFCSGIQHAEHVALKLNEITGEDVGVVHSKRKLESNTGDIERFSRVKKFGDMFAKVKVVEPMRFLVNMDKLTTGSNIPRIDCIVLLRKTASPGLFVQMVGRGLRPFDTKENCLVLDYGENILNHGCIDNIRPPKDKDDDKLLDEETESKAMTRCCPQCFTYNIVQLKSCAECGFIFPVEEKAKHEKEASDLCITTTEQEERAPEVDHIKIYTLDDYELLHYKLHQFSSCGEIVRCVKASYDVGERFPVTELFYPENKDAQRRSWFASTWKRMSKARVPDSVEDFLFLANSGAIGLWHKIKVDFSSEYPEITYRATSKAKPANKALWDKKVVHKKKETADEVQSRMRAEWAEPW